MSAMFSAQEVAILLMKHSGCHQINIVELSSKHREMMKKHKQYNQSHISECVSVINSCSSKGLRFSDSSKKSSVVSKTYNRLRTFKSSDIIPGQPVKIDEKHNPVLNPDPDVISVTRHKKPSYLMRFFLEFLKNYLLKQKIIMMI